MKKIKAELNRSILQPPARVCSRAMLLFVMLTERFRTATTAYVRTLLKVFILYLFIFSQKKNMATRYSNGMFSCDDETLMKKYTSESRGAC